MIVSIAQPAYLPWLGAFDRIYRSDVHVVLDDVQFEKNSMVNRNRVLTRNGPVMLTLPVCTAGKFGNLPINKVKIAGGPWAHKHALTIKQAYSKAPYFDDYWPFFGDLYSKFKGIPWDLFAVALIITSYAFAQMGLRCRLEFSSDLKVPGRKSELVLNICKELGATEYLSGPFGRDYLDLPSFERAGIEVAFHDYQHPTYRQMNAGFVPNMSAIDLLFNEGPDSLAILSGVECSKH